MRIKLAALTIAIVSLLLLPSRAKADTFVYNVTSTHDNVNVTFDEPTFQETVTPTTFTTNTPSLSPVTEFALTANSFCSISSGGFSVMVGAP